MFSGCLSVSHTIHTCVPPARALAGRGFGAASRGWTRSGRRRELEAREKCDGREKGGSREAAGGGKCIKGG